LLPKGAPLLILKQKPAGKSKEEIRREERAQRKKQRSPTKLEKAVKNLTRPKKKK
jgi:hypothetical protein